MNLLKRTHSQFLKGLEKRTRDKIQLINDQMTNLKTEIDKIIKNLQIIKNFMNMEPELLISKQDTKNKEV